MHNALFIGLSITFSSLVLGAPLPKGNLKDIDQGKAKGPSKLVDTAEGCFDNFMYPLAENGSFTSDNKVFYLLGTAGQLNRRGKKKLKSGPLYRYILFSLDMENGKVAQEVALGHREDASLMTFGEPVLGVQAVAFDGKEKACGSGRAGLIGVSFKAGAKAVRTVGNYTIVPGRRGRVLLDLDKSRLTETDLTTFQTRLLTPISAKERPLYYDSGRKFLITFKTENQRRGLVRYKVLASRLEEERKLAIGKTDRVVRDGSKFGFIQLNSIDNSFVIRQVPIWTGGSKIVSTKFSLPDGVRGSDALYIPSFDAQLLVVTGKTISTRVQWGGVLLYDLKTGKLIKRIDADKGGYFNYVGFSHRGDRLIAEAKNGDVSRALHVYNTIEKTSVTFNLNK